MPITVVAIRLMMLVVVGQLPDLDEAGGVTDVRLTLSTDRSSYYVGEPIRFRLRAHNNGSEPVRGYFAIWGEETDIQWRSGQNPFASIYSRPSSMEGSDPGGVDVVRGSSTIRADEERASSILLGVVPATGAILLAEAGKVEFRVLCRPQPKIASITAGRPVFDAVALESNPVSVIVDNPPDVEAKALADYLRSRLVPFLQTPVAVSRQEPGVLGRAASFLDRHPTGVYSDHVREALVEALASKVRKGQATEDEGVLYEQLKKTPRQVRE
jgi:hypothetical protein